MNNINQHTKNTETNGAIALKVPVTAFLAASKRKPGHGNIFVSPGIVIECHGIAFETPGIVIETPGIAFETIKRAIVKLRRMFVKPGNPIGTHLIQLEAILLINKLTF